MSKFNGHPTWAIGRGRSKISYPVPSGGVLDLRAFDGKLVHVNTTATITTILAPPNGECMVIFDAVCILTYSLSLLLPGAANITTAAGDCMQVVDEDGISAHVLSYTKANGLAIASGFSPLATIIPTASAVVNFLTTFTADYDNYRIFCNGLIHGGGAASDNLLLRAANAGVVDTAANYTAAATSITLGSLWGVGKGATFTFDICNVNSATTMKLITGASATQNNAVPNYSAAAIQQLYIGVAVSGLSLFWNSGGNFGPQGSVRIRGYNN